MFKLFQNIVGNNAEEMNSSKENGGLTSALVSANSDSNSLSLSNRSSALESKNNSSWQQGSIQESMQFYDQAILKNADDPQAVYRDLCSHFKQQKSVANGYKTLAESLRRKGRNEEAAACYRQAIVIQAVINEAEDRYGSLSEKANVVVNSESFDLVDDAFSFRSSIRADLVHRPQNLLQIQFPADFVVEDSLANTSEDLNSIRDATVEWEAAQVFMQKALDSYERKDWSGVASACEQATQIAPSMAEAYKIWGNALQRLNQTAEAMECYRKVVEIQPDLAEVYFGIAELYAQQQKWRPASGYYQKAIIIKPEFARAYSSLAYVWEQAGHLDKAKICKERAKEIGNVSLLPSLTDIQQQESPEIAKLANGSENDQEILVTNFHHLGQRSEQQQRWQEASNYYRKALELHLSNNQKLITAETDDNLGVQAAVDQDLKVVDQDSSRQLVEPNSLLASDQNFSNPVDVNNSQSQHNSNFDQEILEYLQVTKSQPNSILNHLALGDLYVKRKKWQSAISSYNKAIRVNPQEPIAHFKLAQIFNKVGNHNGYIDHSYFAYSLKPELGSADEHFELGNLLSNLGYFKKAIVCHKQAIKMQPHFVEAYQALGEMWVKLRKYNQAKACYKSAIEQNPRHVDFYIALGDLVMRDRNWEVAVNIFRKVLQIQPKSSEASQKLNYALSQKLQNGLATKYSKVS